MTDHETYRATIRLPQFESLALRNLSDESWGTPPRVIRGLLGSKIERHDYLVELLKGAREQDPDSPCEEIIDGVLDVVFARHAISELARSGMARAFLSQLKAETPQTQLRVALTVRRELAKHNNGEESQIVALPSGGRWESVGESGRFWLLEYGERATANGIERTPRVSPWDQEDGDE